MVESAPEGAGSPPANDVSGWAAHLAESPGLPTVVVGRDGLVRRFSPAVATWLSGGIGQPIARWLHGEPGAIEAMIAATAPWRGRVTMLAGEGPPLEASLEAYPFEDGVVILVLPEVVPLLRLQEEIGAINSELTNMHRERVKQAAQLERSAAALAEANRRLEELDRLKSRFYANMNHELRTPLNSIIGFAEDALDGLAGPLNDELAQYFTTIFRSGQRQLALITDVLDLARLQAGKATLECAELPLAELVAEIREALRPLLARKRQTFTATIGPEVVLRADHQKTYQILLNLLSNAHKYGAAGGRIGLTATREGDAWRIEVSDDGPGIPAEELPRLFEEFYQADRRRTTGAQGTGLGLAITRQLVELHGGRIHAESPPGQGARFVFTLPAATEERP